MDQPCLGALIQPEPLSQPAYVALSAFRETAPPAGPAVALLGTDPIDTKLSADQLRELETADIASTIAAALRGDEPWSVFDPTRAGNGTDAAAGDDDAGWRRRSRAMCAFCSRLERVSPR